MPSLATGPTQVTFRGNVRSLDASGRVQMFTFGPRWQGIALRESRMVQKNQKKIGKANGMPSLQIVPTQVTLRGNVGSLDAPRASQLFMFFPRGQGIALSVVNGLKNPQK